MIVHSSLLIILLLIRYPSYIFPKFLILFKYKSILLSSGSNLILDIELLLLLYFLIFSLILLIYSIFFSIFIQSLIIIFNLLSSFHSLFISFPFSNDIFILLGNCSAFLIISSLNNLLSNSLSISFKISSSL